MERDYLEWINKSYAYLCRNINVPKMELNTLDGKISVYRVKNIIRIDINRTETKLK